MMLKQRRNNLSTGSIFPYLKTYVKSFSNLFFLNLIMKTVLKIILIYLFNFQFGLIMEIRMLLKVTLD